RGKNFLEVDTVALAEQAARLSEIENAAFSAGGEDSRNFTQARVVVGQVSKSEGRCHQIEMAIGKRQPEGVRFDPRKCRATSLLRLRRCALQHGVGKIRSQNLRSSRARAPS